MGGDVDGAVPTGDERADLVGRQGHRDHAARTRQLHDRLAAQRHDLRRVVERQRPGHRGGRDLTLRVADHRIRLDARRTPQRGQGHHHRPQRGLHHIHPIEAGGALRTAQDVRQRPVGARRQRPLALGQPGGEHRGGLQEFQSHALPLRALPREHEHRLARARDRALHQVRRGPARGQRVKARQQLIPAGARNRRPDGEVRDPGGERRSHPRRIDALRGQQLTHLRRPAPPRPPRSSPRPPAEAPPPPARRLRPGPGPAPGAHARSCR